jgi:hypothetical protein
MGLLQKSTYSAVSETTTHTINLQSTATAGTTLIALVTSTALISTPSGWTKIQGNLNGLDMGAFRKTSVGTETSVTFTISAARGLNAVIYEFNDLGSTVSAANGFSSTSSSDLQFNVYTAPQDVRLFAFIGLGPTDVAAGTSWTGGNLNSNKDALHASTITDSQTQLSAYAEVASGASFRPVTYPGSVKPNVQGTVVAIAYTATPAVIVSVGSDQVIESNNAASLSASVSGGLGGSYTYAWTISNGPTGVFSAATAASTTFTPSGVGTYTLVCTATDSSGNGSDSLILTVNQAQYYSVRQSGVWIHPEVRVRKNNTWN